MPRSAASSNAGVQPIGQAWLRSNLDLPVPPPAHESFVGTGVRRTEVHGGRVLEFYPTTYAVADDPVAHLKFALRHEPIDLTLLVAALRALPEGDLVAWVGREPTGAFARRAWFLFETFVGGCTEFVGVVTATATPASPCLRSLRRCCHTRPPRDPGPELHWPIVTVAPSSGSPETLTGAPDTAASPAIPVRLTSIVVGSSTSAGRCGQPVSITRASASAVIARS
jgi:hypothetical protein